MQRLAFILILLNSIMAFAQQDCPQDPMAVINKISEKFIQQRKSMTYSKGITRFSDINHNFIALIRESRNSNVIYKYLNGTVLNKSDKLPVTDAHYAIAMDISGTREGVGPAALTSENYKIEYLEAQGNNLVYQLTPWVSKKGLFSKNSRLYVDKKTCVPVRATGELIAPVTVNTEISFTTIKGLFIPKNTQISGSIPFRPRPLSVIIDSFYDERGITLDEEKEGYTNNAPRSSQR